MAGLAKGRAYKERGAHLVSPILKKDGLDLFVRLDYNLIR